jgi:hypothetical protein
MRLIRPHGRTFSTAFPPHGGAAGGGGGGSSTKPDIWPNDGTYGWEFLGANDTARSGDLQDNSNGAFLAGAGGYTFASGAGPNGIHAALASYTQGGGDHSPACNLNMAGPGSGGIVTLGPFKKLYVRFAHKKTTNTGNAWKLLRMKDLNTNAFLWTPGYDDQIPNVFESHCDSWDTGSLDLTGQAPSNSTWHWMEFFLDFTTAGAVNRKMWLDDVLVQDITRNYSAQTPSPSTSGVDLLNFASTINDPLAGGSGQSLISMIGLSSQQMGIPPGF